MASLFRSPGALALVGAVAFGVLFESPAGLVAGAVIGALWATVNRLMGQVDALEGGLRDTTRRVEVLAERLRAVAVQPPPARAAHAEPATPAERSRPVEPTAAAAPRSSPTGPAPTVVPGLPEEPPALPPPMGPVDASHGAGPATVASPNHWSRLLAAVAEFCTTGNVVAKVGVVILFVGVAFLVRFAADRGLLPIEYRLMGVTVAAMAALGLGWRLRRARPDFAMAVQGGAVGVLYLTIFAAFRLYDLVPPGLALGLMLAVVALSGALAVLQDQLTLAVLGTSGGFLAPLLASTGGGSHVALFSYYLMLNAGVLGLAWFRAWRILNWLGFLFTFGIGFVWGSQYYQPQMFSTTEPFLVAFFLLYVAVSVLFATRQAPELLGHIDGSLVFGLPAVAFAMQSRLTSEIELGRAYSAVVLSAFYLVLSRALWRRAPSLAPLAESFLALGVVFLTLALPLAFDGHAVAAGWALEGAALVWVGFRQHRLLARIAGAVLVVGAGVGFLAISSHSASDLAVLNTRFLGGVSVAVGALIAAHQFFSHRAAARSWEQPIEAALLVWGLTWWMGIVVHELTRFTSGSALVGSISLAVSTSAVAIGALSRRLSWPGLGLATTAFFPLTALLVAAAFLQSQFDGTRSAPWAHLGWAAWPTTIVAGAVTLRLFEGQWPGIVVRAGHAVILWLGAFVAAWMAAAAVSRAVPEGPTWARVTWAVVPALLAYGLVARADRLPWPVSLSPSFFRTVVAGVPLAAGTAWCLVALGLAGDPAPLPYVPLFNPLELTQAFTLFAVTAWARQADQERLKGATLRQPVGWAVVVVAFLCLNAVVARSVHFSTGIPYEPEALTASPIFQASISVLWAVTSLGLMSVASRRAQRTSWVVGASLLAALVAKLFTVDLGGIGTVARIVSFLATGLLIMVIGYFSPAPPRRRDA